MAADLSPVPMGCAINFQGCRESQYNDDTLKKDGNGRTVAVIGAGPAGMEAARVLAMRGFNPVVFEKQEQAGGQIVLASKPPKKEKPEAPARETGRGGTPEYGAHHGRTEGIRALCRVRIPRI